jgi:hypothetical protein
LDHGHLRFFTRREIEKLLRETGFALVTAEAVPGPGYSAWAAQGRPGTVEAGRLRVRGLSPEDAEEFFAYQYLVTATPRKSDGVSPDVAKSWTSGTSGRLGCILAIRNRPKEWLYRTLQTYGYQTLAPADKVLADYGSSNGLAEAYRSLCRDAGWRYLRIDPAVPGLNLSIAYNRAVAALDKEVEIVFKGDLDVLLGENVLEIAAREAAARFCVFSCLAAAKETPYPERIASHADLVALLHGRHPPGPMDGEGVHAFPRKWFEAIGGYDHQFVHWGYEDPDLRLRAQWSIGITRVREAILIHQWHSRNGQAEVAEANRRYYEGMKRTGLLVRNGGPLSAAG